MPSGSIAARAAAQLAESMRALLETLARAANRASLAPFLDAWPKTLQVREVAPSGEVLASGEVAPSREVVPSREVASNSQYPVLHCLPTVCAARLAGLAPVGGTQTLVACTRVLSAVAAAASTLTWRQTYTACDVDPAFLANYAWAEILGSSGPIAASSLAAGLLLLGPRTLYPRHRHLAPEIYVPLSGTAEWQQGDQTWGARSPGTLIYHRSEEGHAMRTAADPLLAMYVWRATDAAGTALSRSARLDP